MSEVLKHNAKLWERRGQTSGFFLIWCPACKCGHDFPVPRWAFNGNVDRPTFTPSMLIFTPEVEGSPRRTICHFNVTDGKVIYHNDSPHALGGTTIELADIPPEYGF